MGYHEAETDHVIKNIILDVDGTLWNTTGIVESAWNKVIQADGRSQARVDAAKLKQLFGKQMDVIGKLLFTDVSGEACAELLDACCQAEQEALLKNKKPLLYPHVWETIQCLAKGQGRKLFIVSNCQSGYIELFMEKNKIEPYIADHECFGNNGLPKGENIALLMKRNGLALQECIYVGDTAGDYEASKEAGIPFLFAAYGFGKVEGTRQIRDFSELLGLP